MSWSRLCLSHAKLLFKCSINVHLKMPYYAVARGRTPGIFMTWPDCESQVKGFQGARYKKFNTAADAEKFIITEGDTKVTQKNKAIKSGKQKGNYDEQPSNLLKNDKPAQSAKKRNSKISDKISSDEEFDDLNTVLTKQMDDIEKRLKGFEKNVDKIIKKSTKTADKRTILIDPPTPAKKHKSGNFDFIEDNDGYVQVYTDGACSSNGKNGARAGIGVYWGDNHPLNVSEPVTGRATNNCGEIQAATSAIKIALQSKINKLAINTDSQFLINSVTKWMTGWKQKGWKLRSGEPVKNEKDFKELDNVQNKLLIKWIYVEAHKGIHGNEMADQLAKAGASRYVK